MLIKRYATDEKAAEIRKAIKEAEGHCPCVLKAARCPETMCICKEFRDSPAGTICHCGLYIKVED